MAHARRGIRRPGSRAGVPGDVCRRPAALRKGRDMAALSSSWARPRGRGGRPGGANTTTPQQEKDHRRSGGALGRPLERAGAERELAARAAAQDLQLELGLRREDEDALQVVE